MTKGNDDNTPQIEQQQEAATSPVMCADLLDMIIGEPRPHDWPEDFKHENGCYQNNCCHCNTLFIGHKRRVSCRVCVDKAREAWNALTDEEKAESVKKSAEALERLLS